MFRTIFVIVAVTTFTNSAELSTTYSPVEKHATFKPDLKTEPIIKAKELLKHEHHPVYKPEEHHKKRIKIEPVRPLGPVITHERMLSDQPPASTEINRIDNLAIPGYAYVPSTLETTYPDIPYAPGYGYDPGFSSKNYEMYDNSPSPYYIEPDASPFSLIWSQVPDSRAIVSFVSRIISWMFGSIFVLLIGSLLTVGVCSYTNLCVITFNGVGPIREEMRSLMSPERLEKISNAADFVKNAIDKYQKIQTVSDVMATKRRRRSVYF